MKKYVKNASAVPFSIDKKKRGSLVDQVADGLEKAIASGYYRPGAVLPKIREFAEALDVSLRVPVAALKRLSDKGMVSVRPHYGSVVIGPAAVWRARVLIVFAGDPANYHANLFVHALRERLSESSVHVSQVAVSHRTRPRELGFLRSVLREAFNLTVLMQTDQKLIDAVSDAGRPFVTVGCPGRSVNGCVGSVTYRRDLAVADFVSACVSAKVRRVLQVKARPEVDVRLALETAGIEVCDWELPERHGPGIREQVRKDAFEFVSARVARRKDVPGEMVFFNDDHAATGGMLALAARGISVPEDIGMVSWANAGDLPVASVPLSCMLMDPQEQGMQVALAVEKFLDEGRFPADLTIGPKFVAGDSFPCR